MSRLWWINARYSQPEAFNERLKVSHFHNMITFQTTLNFGHATFQRSGVMKLQDSLIVVWVMGYECLVTMTANSQFLIPLFRRGTPQQSCPNQSELCGVSAILAGKLDLWKQYTLPALEGFFPSEGFLPPFLPQLAVSGFVSPPLDCTAGFVPLGQLDLFSSDEGFVTVGNYFLVIRVNAPLEYECKVK